MGVLLQQDRQSHRWRRPAPSSRLNNPIQRSEEQADSKIANLFKKDEKLEQAAATYEESAKIYEEVKDRSGAAQMMGEAVNIYRQLSPTDAVRGMVKTIELFKADGNFRRANTYYEQLAVLYEEQNDLPRAKDAYMAAASGQRIENSVAIANKSFDKAAELTALLAQKPDDYHDARDIFLDCARSNMRDRTLRFGVKNSLFKAGRECVPFLSMTLY